MPLPASRGLHLVLSSDVGGNFEEGQRLGNPEMGLLGMRNNGIQSAKSESNEEADDLSDAVFEASYEELYSIRGRWK